MNLRYSIIAENSIELDRGTKYSYTIEQLDKSILEGALKNLIDSALYWYENVSLVRLEYRDFPWICRKELKESNRNFILHIYLKDREVARTSEISE